MTHRQTGTRGSLLTVALIAPLLVHGCAPGRAAPGPTSAPETAQPAPGPRPAPSASPTPSPAPERIDFAKQVRPLLEEKCTPCHFPGGRMYDRLPFDREGTVRVLGTAMLTRLRDPVDQELLRAFLAQPIEEPGAAPAPDGGGPR